MLYALAIATLLGPGKRTPPSSPKKSFFLSFPKELDTWWGPFSRGEPNWKIGTALVSPIFFSTSSCLFSTSKSGWECPHRWRNSPGVAPSMSQKGSLMLRKNYGEKPAQKIAKNMSCLGT